MQINLTRQHMCITASIRSFVDEKFDRLERHLDHITNIHVILTVEKDHQKVEGHNPCQ
jgi:putative sigma-54 modulation protein